MADLISRKALLEELDKWINPCVNYDKSEFLSGIATAISEVETAPTVDAAPVVHGRWIFNQEQWTWDCTNCKGWVGSGVRIRGYEYCPNCGAKMDGGNDDENFSSLRRKPGGDD